jgi:Tfp pilus assembly protein PilF
MLPSSVPWIRRPGAGVSALLRHLHGPILIGGSHSLITPNHLSVVWARMFSPKLLGSVSSLVAQNQGVHARVSEGAGAWAQLAGTYAWHTNIGFNASALDSAQDFARRALALDPNDANAQSVLGNAYVNMGRLRCAETAARRSLELHPNQSRAVRALAELHRDGGDFAEAMKYHPRTENDSLTCTPTNLAEWLPLSDRALHRRFRTRPPPRGAGYRHRGSGGALCDHAARICVRPRVLLGVDAPARADVRSAPAEIRVSTELSIASAAMSRRCGERSRRMRAIRCRSMTPRASADERRAEGSRAIGTVPSARLPQPPSGSGSSRRLCFLCPGRYSPELQTDPSRSIDGGPRAHRGRSR